MQRKHSDLLDKHRPFLIRNLKLSDRLLTTLQTLLSQQSLCNIKATTDDHKATSMLLERLKRAGPTAFDHFLLALHSSQQHSVLLRICPGPQGRGVVSSGRGVVSGGRGVVTGGKGVVSGGRGVVNGSCGGDKSFESVLRRARIDNKENSQAIGRESSLKELRSVVEWRRDVSKEALDFITMR